MGQNNNIRIINTIKTHIINNIIDKLYPKYVPIDYSSQSSMIHQETEKIYENAKNARINLSKHKYGTKIRNYIAKNISKYEENQFKSIVYYLTWWDCAPLTMDHLIDITAWNIIKYKNAIITTIFISCALIIYNYIIGGVVALVMAYLIYLLTFANISFTISKYKEIYDNLRNEAILFAPATIPCAMEPTVAKMINKLNDGGIGSISHEIKKVSSYVDPQETFGIYIDTHPCKSLKYLGNLSKEEDSFTDIGWKLEYVIDKVLDTISKELETMFMSISRKLADKFRVASMSSMHIPILVPLFFGMIGWGSSPLLALQIIITWMFLIKGIRKSMVSGETQYLVKLDKIQDEKKYAKEYANKYGLKLSIIGWLLSIFGGSFNGTVDYLGFIIFGPTFAFAIIAMMAAVTVDKIRYYSPIETLDAIKNFCDNLKNKNKIDGEVNNALATSLTGSFPIEIEEEIIKCAVDFNEEYHLEKAATYLPPFTRPFLRGLIPICNVGNINLKNVSIKRSKVLEKYNLLLDRLVSSAMKWSAQEEELNSQNKYVCVLLGIMMGVIVSVGSMMNGMLNVLFQGLSLNLGAIFQSLGLIFANMGNVIPFMTIICGLGVGVGTVAMSMDNRMKNITMAIIAYIVTILVLGAILKLSIGMMGDVSTIFTGFGDADMFSGGLDSVMGAL